MLGGTAEARAVAADLHGRGDHVTTSLAGRVADPKLPVGDVRIGGFGGVEPMAAWLLEAEVDAVVDATHPFAKTISGNAVEACARAGVRLLRLHRPGWKAMPGDRWHWVDDLEAAAALVPDLGTRVLLTTGRQGLSAFADVDAWFLIRTVDHPDPPLPARHELVLDRGPYTLAGELALIDTHDISLVVAKDSGGDHTRAKLDAARQRTLPVIVVRRPPRPDAETVDSVEAALEWVRRRP